MLQQQKKYTEGFKGIVYIQFLSGYVMLYNESYKNVPPHREILTFKNLVPLDNKPGDNRGTTINYIKLYKYITMLTIFLIVSLKCLIQSNQIKEKKKSEILRNALSVKYEATNRNQLA